jgi:flagellar biosynthesis protein FlhA
LGELIRKHAQELLGRQEVKRLLDSMNETHPKLVEELVPKLMSMGEVQKVLQQLLREQVSIRDLGTILEVLVEAAHVSKSIVHLVESVRMALGRGIVARLLDREGGLRVMTMQPGMEQEVVGTFDPTTAVRLLGSGAVNPGDCLRRLMESVKSLTGAGQGSALPVLLCPSPARYHLKRWLEPLLPKVTVLAAQEIPPEIRVRSVGTVG